MKVKDYVYLAVILLLIGSSGFLGYKYFNSEKRYDILDEEYDVVVKERDACWNAPEKIIYKDTTIYSHDTIYPETKTITKHIETTDTLWMERGEEDIPKQFYSDVYENNGFKLHWESMVYGYIDWIAFPEYTYPTKLTIRTVDTCIMKPPHYKPLNHWGADFNLIGNNFGQFPNMDAVVWFTIRDRWGFNGGIEYNAYHNEVYGKLGVKIFLGKFGKRS